MKIPHLNVNVSANWVISTQCSEFFLLCKNNQPKNNPFAKRAYFGVTNLASIQCHGPLIIDEAKAICFAHLHILEITAGHSCICHPRMVIIVSDLRNNLCKKDTLIFIPEIPSQNRCCISMWKVPSLQPKIGTYLQGRILKLRKLCE